MFLAFDFREFGSESGVSRNGALTSDFYFCAKMRNVGIGFVVIFLYIFFKIFEILDYFRDFFLIWKRFCSKFRFFGPALRPCRVSDSKDVCVCVSVCVSRTLLKS
jgi:hypothetical protein